MSLKYQFLRFNLLFIPRVIISLLVFTSCNKSELPIKNIFIKTDLNTPVDYNIKEIIPIPDNTFWIHSEKSGAPYEDKIEHYDENFKLLDQVNFKNIRFGNFVVNGNNNIVVAILRNYPLLNYGKHQFLQFDNHINIIAQDTSDLIDTKLAPMDPFISNINLLTRLTNEKYILGFNTFKTNGTINDTSRIIMASYLNPILSPMPLWVNHNRYFNYSLGITSPRLVDLEADKHNNYYALAETDGPFGVFRKHDSVGRMIWQTKFPTDYNWPYGNEIKLMVEEERIWATIDRKLYSCDLQGNLTSTDLAGRSFYNAIPLSNKEGYIAVSDSENVSGRYTRVLKLDHNFNAVKAKLYGNQETQGAIIGRLANGKIVVASFVIAPNRNDYHLMLLKMNDELELVN